MIERDTADTDAVIAAPGFAGPTRSHSYISSRARREDVTGSARALQPQLRLQQPQLGGSLSVTASEVDDNAPRRSQAVTAVAMHDASALASGYVVGVDPVPLVALAREGEVQR
jgi:hypothetical protein